MTGGFGAIGLSPRMANYIMCVLLYIPLFISVMAEVVSSGKMQRRTFRFSRDWGYRQLLVSQALLACGGLGAGIVMYIIQWDFPFAHASYLPVPKIARRPLLIIGFLSATMGSTTLVVMGVSSSLMRRAALRGNLLRIMAGGWSMISLCAFLQDSGYVHITVSIIALWLQEETRGIINAAACIEAYIGAMHFWAGMGKLNASFLHRPPRAITLMVEPFVFESLRPVAYWMCPLVEIFGLIVMCTRWRRMACGVFFVYHSLIVVSLLTLGADAVAFFWQVGLLVPMFRGTIDKHVGYSDAKSKVTEKTLPATSTSTNKKHVYDNMSWIVMLGTLTWGATSPRSFEIYPGSTNAGAAVVAVSNRRHPIAREALPRTLRNMMSEKGCLRMSTWILGHDPSGPVNGAAFVSEALGPSIEVDVLLFANSLPTHRRVLAMLGMAGESDFSAATRLIRC